MEMRGDQPLLEIAIALNFSSQANFTRAFRVGTGMTRSQFRRDFARPKLRNRGITSVIPG